MQTTSRKCPLNLFLDWGTRFHTSTRVSIITMLKIMISLPIHEYAASLGEEICSGLRLWYAFTGCDTVSSFAGRGKKMAWAAWNAYHEVTETFLRLSQSDVREVSEDDLKNLERYIVLLYDRSSSLDEVNDCRRSLFATKGRSIECIPPTKDALIQHSKRALLQGGIIWGQTIKQHQHLPDFNAFGWNVTDETMQPRWMMMPEASKACYELVQCGCRQNCFSRCRCKQHSLECTELCKCGGQCTEFHE